MKIWLMNHYATNQFTARAGRHYWFAKELKRRGYDVTVFCATTFLDNEDEIDTGGEKVYCKKNGRYTVCFRQDNSIFRKWHR